MDYAAVVSLVQTIHRLLNPGESKIHLRNSQLEFISDELSNLQSFLEKTRYEPSSKRVVERGVRDAARKLEDLIDYHLSDLSLPAAGANPDGLLTLLLSQHLPKVRQQITTCFTQTSKADYYYSLASHDNVRSTPAKRKIVGFEKQLHELKFMVLSPISDLQVIPVVGMAGIGKTTIVQEIYSDPFVVGDFEHCLLLQIGPEYQLEDILRRALLQLHVDHSHKIVSVEELRDCVHRTLYHVKYLIVLEDIWETGIWDMLKHNFPNTYSGSRIIITTQMVSLARYASTHGSLEVPFLTDDQSWILLRETVFTSEERCSPQLEKIGKKIAKKCEGLPLAVIQVGELLSKIEKKVEKWEEIAEKEDPISITTDDNTPLSEALSLSYRMLPQYLKVCFLYMAVFPKYYVVTNSKLIQLWVSEGFLEPQTSRSLEEVGAEYLESLVSRSVVLNDKLSSIDVEKTKTCKLHFTFRNICASEAKNERLYPIIKKYDDSLEEDINSQHRLCIHNHIVIGFEQVHKWMESAPDVRSVLCFGPRQQYPTALYLRFRLLKVLDALAIRFYRFPYQVLDLFHLRYLAITYDGEELPPASISCLWNLEVFIVHRHHIIISPNFPAYLPMEIWKLHKLKHLECMGFDLPDPTTSADDSLILEKLLTITGVSPASCTGGVLTRIPNLARIGIKIVSAHDSVETFSFFGDFASAYEEFRSFKCVVINPSLHRPQILAAPCIDFPVNIKKITLSGCAFPWEYMRVIAKLPNLQVLKLRWYAFCGPVWSMSEEDFPKLKFLLLEDLDIQHWETENRHLPSLESLIVRNCYNLETMPSRIEYCANLKLIEVDDCSNYATVWTQDIQDYCETFGLGHLQICITSSWLAKNPM